MSASLLMCFYLAAVPPDDGAIRSAAVAGAKDVFDKLLKSPGSAVYAADGVGPAPPSTVLVPGRYFVEGHVDSQNVVGVSLRTRWVVEVAVPVEGEGKPEVLQVVAFPSSGEPKTVFRGPPVRRYRKDVYEAVQADFLAHVEKQRETAKRFPASKKAQFLRQGTAKFVETERRKFGMTGKEMLEIVSPSR